MKENEAKPEDKKLENKKIDAENALKNALRNRITTNAAILGYADVAIASLDKVIGIDEPFAKIPVVGRIHAIAKKAQEDILAIVAENFGMQEIIPGKSGKDVTVTPVKIVTVESKKDEAGSEPKMRSDSEKPKVDETKPHLEK